MRICGIICEFNPFHNGHKYLLQRAKELSGCDKILCIMSGSFTQRGDICVSDKFTRARHAILCGADGVIELPVAFAVAPAEIFARGAIKILSSIPEVTTLAFGCESAKTDFIKAAILLNEEKGQFKTVLSEKLAAGESYIRSYAAAFEACGGEKNLLSRPNNILGIEYAKAILKLKSKIEILPIERIGAEYGDNELKSNFSSASAIRNNPNNPLIKDNLPDCVFADFKDFSEETSRFEELLRFKLLQSASENLQKIYGCNEGLENKLISSASLPFGEIIESATARRYSASRIKRILCANLLDLYSDDCESYLQTFLYIKPLTVKKDDAQMLSALAKSEFPVIMKQRDLNDLNPTAQKCFKTDKNAYKIWKFIAKQPESGFDYVKFI